MASEAARQGLRQAEAEGLTLQPRNNMTGFKGVHFKSGRSKPYEAQVCRGGKNVHLGRFATAEEAAPCYARDIAVNGLSAAAAARMAAPAALTAEEALRQAEAEGLALQPSKSRTGFKGVSPACTSMQTGDNVKVEVHVGGDDDDEEDAIELEAHVLVDDMLEEDGQNGDLDVGGEDANNEDEIELEAVVEDDSAMARHRWKPDPLEKALLEEAFKIEKLPSSRTKKRIAKQLRVKERNIAVWFQNRRQRLNAGNPANAGAHVIKMDRKGRQVTFGGPCRQPRGPGGKLRMKWIHSTLTKEVFISSSGPSPSRGVSQAQMTGSVRTPAKATISTAAPAEDGSPIDPRTASDLSEAVWDPSSKTWVPPPSKAMSHAACAQPPPAPPSTYVPAGYPPGYAPPGYYPDHPPPPGYPYAPPPTPYGYAPPWHPAYGYAPPPHGYLYPPPHHPYGYAPSPPGYMPGYPPHPWYGHMPGPMLMPTLHDSISHAQQTLHGSHAQQTQTLHDSMNEEPLDC